MFRDMRRKGQALSRQACLTVLEEAPRGVLAVHGEDGYPYAFPMDYLFTAGRLVFHCAREGHKLDALRADDRASFCVMGEGLRQEGEWALRIPSVIVFGRVREVDDPAEAAALLRLLGRKYYPTPEEADTTAAASASRAVILEMTVEHMTGKTVKES